MSSSFRIFVTEPFLENVPTIPPALRLKIENKLRAYVYPQLASQPHYGPNIKKLKGSIIGTWRYRIGSWRFFTTSITEIKLFS